MTERELKEAIKLTVRNTELEDEAKAYKQGAAHDSKIIHELQDEVRRLREALRFIQIAAVNGEGDMDPEQECCEIATEALKGVKG